MKRRLLAMLLALVLCLSLLPATALADEPADVNWQGAGTEGSPYLLNSTKDVELLSQRSANETFESTYFKFGADITLPSGWTPIGTTEKRFSGSIDGDGHTLTVPAGEKALLGATVNATLKNLNIRGENINGNGVVNIYTTGTEYKGKTCITIENVTLKKGTKTTGSGFVGGYSHGDHPVIIRNCTVEEGVTIGDGSASNIGSFGGDFNGTIIGCVSHATVKGNDYVGGICGSKGQSMGDYVIIDCIFDGTVEASGECVGGISGGGYFATSAPNTPCVTIMNCLCSGEITGRDKVGGILGAEPGVKECWNNGVGYIQSNLFTGTVTATGGNASSGGIVGYLSSLNNAMVISDNYYLNTAAKGIGVIEMVETPESSGTFDEGWNEYTLNGAQYGRTDDPAGAGADKLAKAVSAAELKEDGTVLAALNAGMNSSGNWTQGTDYPVFTAYGDTHLVRIVCGDLNTMNGVSQSLDGDVLKGKTLILQYNDGSTATLAATDASVAKGYSPTEADVGKYIPATITVQGHQLEFNLRIEAPAAAPTAPIIRDSASETATAYIGQPLTVDLKSIFEDANGLDLTYTAKLPGAKEYVDIETTNGVYTYPEALSEAGELVFSFKASNGSTKSEAFTLTVTVTARSDSAEDAVVYLTVSNKGVLATATDGTVMADQPVTVKDINSDGKLSFDEALVAAHTAYNSAEGYDTASDRNSVTKLWGESTSNTLFFVNNEGLTSGVGKDTVKAGDHLVASVNADGTYYADWYSFFNKRTETAAVGENITLNLKGHLGMGYTEEDTTNVGLAGITVKTVDGAVLGTTDESGNVTFTVDGPGTYVVTAAGTVSGTITDWNLQPFDPELGFYVAIDYATFDVNVAYTETDYGDGPYPADEVKYVDIYELEEMDESVLDQYHLLYSNKLLADCPIIAPACVVTVDAPSAPDEDTISVSFTLLGDSAHGEGGTAHTLRGNNLETWVPKTSYTVDINATVKDVVDRALAENNMTCSNPTGNYIESITRESVTLGEFTNGANSGWMYTLNGEHPLLGVSEQTLEDGDVIVFHYTDDYNREQGSEDWGPAPGASTDETGAATEIKPEVTVNTQGEAKVELSEEEINSAVGDAKSDGSDTLVIAPEVNGEADKVSVELPKDAVNSVAAKSDLDVKIDAGIAEITVKNEGMTELNKLDGDVTIAAETVKDSAGKTTGEVKVEIAVDGKAVEKLDSGVTVAVPAAAAKPGNVLAIVNADGTETIVKKSIVEGQTVAGIVDGSCTVKIVDNSKTFSDTASHWGKDAIAFAGSHELFAGTSATKFSPDMAMNRAMLATVLYRLEDAVASGSNPFADVPADTWYTDAVTWASGAGIVKGYNAGQFGPNDNITREQMAAFLYRYAKTLGMDTAASGDLSKFSDGAKTSGWATDAMKWAVGSGLISGRDNGLVDPTGSATRAEVASILQRMVKLIVK